MGRHEGAAGGVNSWNQQPDVGEGGEMERYQEPELRLFGDRHDALSICYYSFFKDWTGKGMN
jgi:hypothetical protein